MTVSSSKAAARTDGAGEYLGVWAGGNLECSNPNGIGKLTLPVTDSNNKPPNYSGRYPDTMGYRIPAVQSAEWDIRYMQHDGHGVSRFTNVLHQQQQHSVAEHFCSEEDRTGQLPG